MPASRLQVALDPARHRFLLPRDFLVSAAAADVLFFASEAGDPGGFPPTTLTPHRSTPSSARMCRPPAYRPLWLRCLSDRSSPSFHQRKRPRGIVRPRAKVLRETSDLRAGAWPWQTCPWPIPTCPSRPSTVSSCRAVCLSPVSRRVPQTKSPEAFRSQGCRFVSSLSSDRPKTPYTPTCTSCRRSTCR